eukprot:373653-Pyramimonas_sp.AAC.1
MQEARVYSHDGPIRRRKRRYNFTTDRLDTGSAGIFSRRTNQTRSDGRLSLSRTCQTSICCMRGPKVRSLCSFKRAATLSTSALTTVRPARSRLRGLQG